MAKFSKGNRVTVVDNGRLHDWQRKYIGTQGTVDEDDSSPYVILDLDGEREPFFESKLVKEKAMKPKFAKGDKVTIVKPVTFVEYKAKFIGKSFVIEEIRSDGGVSHDGSVGCSVYRPEELRLADEPAEPKFSKASLKTGMLVKTRDGAWHVTQLNTGLTEDYFIDLKDGTNLYLRQTNDDLTDIDGDDDFDIVTVATVKYIGNIFRRFGSNDAESIRGFEVIWEREVGL